MFKKFLNLSLTAQIFLALILGVIVGFLMQDHASTAQTYIAPFGIIFLNLLKFIVVPLVLLSLVMGIVSMNDVKKLGRLGLQTIVYFISTTVVAVTLGLALSTWCRGLFPKVVIPHSGRVEVLNVSLMDQIVDFFPKNMFEPMLTATMMQVIVIALFVGFAIVKVGERAKPLADILESANEVVIAILGFVMKLAPLGVFCMLAPVVAENGATILGSYAALVGMDYLCFLLHALLVYATCVSLLARINPLLFFRHMWPAIIFAFSSDSSLVTLPVTMRCTERLGVSKTIRDFVLPLGATINMDGVAIYLGVTSVFIATCAGIELTMSQYVAIAFSATVASIGTPGIPGGSLALMAMVFASAGIPLEGVAIAAGVDRIVDMGRTSMSITGDASCAVVVNHFEQRGTSRE